MADRAGFGIHGVVPVRFFERVLSLVVTRKAEGEGPLIEKPPLVRTVGKMTGPAAGGLKDLVHHLLLVVFFPVAYIANVVTLCLQQPARL